MGRILLLPSRLRTSFTTGQPTLGSRLRWLVQSRETANFTYELSELGKANVAEVVALVAQIGPDIANVYVQELAGNAALSEFVRQRTLVGPWRYSSDPGSRPAKRYLYYAMARALGPRLTVEAGMDKGYGTCILNEALRRNQAEGRPGAFIGIDQDLERVFLAVEPWVSASSLRSGDSASVLATLGTQVDLFIHDTTNQAEHERSQFAALEQCLSPRGVVISAWYTEELRNFASRTGRRCLLVQDLPESHWYPGSRLGVVFACQ